MEVPIVRATFVSTYPPRRCGIATFTHDLRRASGGGEVVALDSAARASSFPPEVHHRIQRDDRGSYVHAARSMERWTDVVSIQHEYGIWGGEDGAYVLDFVRALDVPTVATLHTVLRRPTTHQREILTELTAATAATVVMSRSAAELLETAYGVDPRRVDVIPHGVPELPLVASGSIKASVGLVGREVILSFGLLGSGKGYELAIDALPAVVAEHPNACYVIVGATHPDLLEREGEAYREALTARAEALGMAAHVTFVDKFVGPAELAHWLEAADVFVTPYPNLDQIVSGTMSYAMSAGRAIVSTPYAYAAELLADGRGILVPPRDPSAFAAAINEVLGDVALRDAMGERAYAYSRRMLWSEVGATYRDLFERVAGSPAAATPRPGELTAVGA